MAAQSTHKRRRKQIRATKPLVPYARLNTISDVGKDTGNARSANGDQLYERVAQILEQAQGQVARTVNSAMVQAYWLIGREIVEVEQAGADRAGYGEELIRRLSARLQAKFGNGFGVRTLEGIRRFYLAFPGASVIPQTLSAESEGPQPPVTPPARAFSPALSWSHYVVLTRIANPQARAFYEIEATRERWSVRQLERQVSALLFDRLANHRAPDKVLALARDGQEIATPRDVFKDPFSLQRPQNGLLRYNADITMTDT